MAGLRLPKRLDVGFDCPNNELMVRERSDLLSPPVSCIGVWNLLHSYSVFFWGDVKFTFALRYALLQAKSSTLAAEPR